MNLLLLLSALLSALTGVVTGVRSPDAPQVMHCAANRVCADRAAVRLLPTRRPVQTTASLAAVAVAPSAMMVAVIAVIPAYASRRRE